MAKMENVRKFHIASRPNRNVHTLVILSYKIAPSVEPNLVKMTELRFFGTIKMLIRIDTIPKIFT